jgi:DNA-binding NtrC family response regulator
MENSKHPLPRILIVDDEKAVRGLLAEVLGESYECDIADSGEAALDLIKATCYSVVITDVEMSGISGVEIVPLILDLSPNTVILLITGSLSQEYAARSKSAGAFDLITKPFDLDSIERSVALAHERHLSLAKISRNAARRDLKLARIARPL